MDRWPYDVRRVDHRGAIMQSLCNSGCVGCAGSVEEKCALVKREREKKTREMQIMSGICMEILGEDAATISNFATVLIRELFSQLATLY